MLNCYTYGAILSIIIPRSVYIIYSASIVRMKENIKFNKDFAVSILKYYISGIISVVSIYFILIIFKPNLNNYQNLIIFSCFFLGELFFLILILNGLKFSEISHLFNLTKSLIKFRKKNSKLE